MKIYQEHWPQKPDTFDDKRVKKKRERKSSWPENLIIWHAFVAMWFTWQRMEWFLILSVCCTAFYANELSCWTCWRLFIIASCSLATLSVKQIFAGDYSSWWQQPGTNKLLIPGPSIFHAGLLTQGTVLPHGNICAPSFPRSKQPSHQDGRLWRKEWLFAVYLETFAERCGRPAAGCFLKKKKCGILYFPW